MLSRRKICSGTDLYSILELNFLHKLLVRNIQYRVNITFLPITVQVENGLNWTNYASTTIEKLYTKQYFNDFIFKYRQFLVFT